MSQEIENPKSEIHSQGFSNFQTQFLFQGLDFIPKTLILQFEFVPDTLYVIIQDSFLSFSRLRTQYKNENEPRKSFVSLLVVSHPQRNIMYSS